MIFGIGLSKTGTGSLVRALRILGYSSLGYPGGDDVIQRMESGRFDLGSLSKYDAIVDAWPLIAWRLLARTYPESRFVLTIRDEKAWLESCAEHWRRHPLKNTKASYYYRVALFGCVEFHRDHFADVYQAHNQAVRDYFVARPDRLLAMNICDGDGWSKLCGFLSRPEPRAKFPHRNRRLHVQSSPSTR